MANSRLLRTVLVAAALFALTLILQASTARAQTTDKAITKVCPTAAIQPKTPDFKPGGIILTTFDKSALWVYDIDKDRRYPLPDTAPCSKTCHLSADGQWVLFFNQPTYTFNRMRIDGTERSLVVDGAGDVSWWNPTTLLIWTPGHDAYLLPDDGSGPRSLDVRGVTSVQPGGMWGVEVEHEGEGFSRVLTDLSLRDIPTAANPEIPLGEDKTYFDDMAWSPDGKWLAFVQPGVYDDALKTAGGELYGLDPTTRQPVAWTNLTRTYGPSRINGLATGMLSWSPDSTRVAFWVTPLIGPDPAANTGKSIIHIYDVATGELRAYCGYSTDEQTPNPPRLTWSLDGTHLAFGGFIPRVSQGYMLMALNTASGVFTTLSDGVYPALGTPDVVAWAPPPPG